MQLGFVYYKYLQILNERLSIIEKTLFRILPLNNLFQIKELRKE